MLDGQEPARSAGCGSPTPAGRRRWAPGAARQPPTLVVVADADGAAGRATTAVVTVPWPRNERGALAGLKTTSYAENVVALAAAAERGATRGGLRQPGRPPVRGHRLQRLLRRRRRAADADAGVGLPGRRDPGAGAGVVRRPRGRRADRGARRRERGLPGLDDPRRAGRRTAGTTASWRRPGRSPGRRRRCGRAWSGETSTREGHRTERGRPRSWAGQGSTWWCAASSDGEQLTDQLVDVEWAHSGPPGDHGDRAVTKR